MRIINGGIYHYEIFFCYKHKKSTKRRCNIKKNKL